MKRGMMMIGIAVAGLLLCTETVQAQSRVVRKAEPDRRGERIERRDDRIERRDDPRRHDNRPVAPDSRVRRKVDADAIRAFERERFDSNRLKMADMIFSTGGVMTTSQIVTISRIFDYDSNRVKFLNMAYGNCIDKALFYRVLNTLDFSSSREKVIEHVMKYNDDPVYLERVSASEMNVIIKTLKDEDFDSTRKKLAQMIANGSLLTSRQIASMAKTFDYDSNRYDFLVFASRNCIDPQNYGIAANTLDFDSNRRKLMDKVARRAR